MDKQKHPAAGVHIDFLRRQVVCHLPALAEFNQNPSQVHWLQLMARFWRKVVSMDSGCLVRQCMQDNIGRMLGGDSTCWAAQFIGCMQHIEVLSAQDVSACQSVQQVLQLSLHNSLVKDKSHAWVQACWSQQLDATDPADADESHVFVNTHQRWVAGAVGQERLASPHTKQLIPVGYKHELVRLRAMSYPLRIMTGRCERVRGADGKLVRLDRSHRLGLACRQPHVEDLPHFLLHCSAYDAIRQQWPAVFHQQASTASILSQSDQRAVASLVHAMLRQRHTSIYSA